MFHKKKYVFALCAIATLITASPKRLNQDNLKNYVEHYVTTLFGRPTYNNREVNEIARNIAHAVKNDNRVAQWNWLEWRYEYNAHDVQEAIHAHVVNHIEDTVRNIAYDYTRDGNTINQLVKHFSNEATRILTQSSNLGGRFADFLHDKLKQKVWRAKEKFDKEWREQQPQIQLYPSEDCCVCMEDFDDVQRIFLFPCGHDICAGCAHQWFFGQHKSSCPHCRSTVNCSKLRETLNI